MFALANTAQFAVFMPTARNDFKVLAFQGTEAISTVHAVQFELVSEYLDFDMESPLT
ncbi:hypothetical protein [Pseudomonas kitaguniensis]|uniref:hypothetical protein n=1 Tax=Pseudomonas kitaguniensis TaxID=2607908 RepID=UPI001561DAA7|nr:hypothetical protein [Pseudomonas kitaguniensis]